MKCRHLLKIDRAAYKLYAKDTTEKMKTDLKLCDKDGDGEKSVKEKKYNSHQGTEQSSPQVLLKSVKKTQHGGHNTFSFC